MESGNISRQKKDLSLHAKFRFMNRSEDISWSALLLSEVSDDLIFDLHLHRNEIEIIDI